MTDPSPTGPGSANIEVSANNFSGTDGQLLLTGNVSVIQGNRSIQADSVAFDGNKQFTVASGNAAYPEPGVVLQGEHLTFDSERQYATVNQHILRCMNLSSAMRHNNLSVKPRVKSRLKTEP